jgi:hypothetical protein
MDEKRARRAVQFASRVLFQGQPGVITDLDQEPNGEWVACFIAQGAEIGQYVPVEEIES